MRADVGALLADNIKVAATNVDRPDERSLDTQMESVLNGLYKLAFPPFAHHARHVNIKGNPVPMMSLQEALTGFEDIKKLLKEKDL